MPSSTSRAPHFAARLQRRRHYEAETREHYGYTLGDYSGVSLVHDDPTGMYRAERVQNGVTLRGAEVYIASCLRAALAAPADMPVVGLDIGGGARLSWLRLAQAFRREIEAGKLVLAATNLRGLDGFVADNLHMRNTYRTLNDAVGSYVPSIQTSFSDIPKQVIPLPDGTTLPLAGNTTVVHERRSLTLWTHIPEVDLAGIGRILARNGTFLARRESALSPLRHPSCLYERAKWMGVAIAHRMLQEEYGLTATTHAVAATGERLELDYKIFHGPGAPRVPAAESIAG